MKKMEVEKDSAGLMSPPLAGGRGSEREMILAWAVARMSATAAAVWTLPTFAPLIEGLKLVDLPKPAVSDGKLLLRVTAAGVTPLGHTILSDQYPRAKAPLVLGNEGAGVVEEGCGTCFPIGSHVMFTGAYGVSEDGAYGEWIAVQKENLCLIPEGVDDVSAAGIPVAYLTAQIALTLAGFQTGKTLLAPTIGESVGNAVTQLARAMGAKHTISSTTNHTKSEQAKALGFNEVIDTSVE